MTIQADDIYSVLSHPMRLRALILIYQTQELCVCELTHALSLAQPVISRHLAQLKASGLLLSRRQGQWIYYRLDPTLPTWVQQLISVTVDGVKNNSPYRDDLQQLNMMANRPGSACCS